MKPMSFFILRLSLDLPIIKLQYSPLLTACRVFVTTQAILHNVAASLQHFFRCNIIVTSLQKLQWCCNDVLQWCCNDAALMLHHSAALMQWCNIVAAMMLQRCCIIASLHRCCIDAASLLQWCCIDVTSFNIFFDATSLHCNDVASMQHHSSNVAQNCLCT